MLYLVLAMGFVNLTLGVAVAMQLGFGPPNLRALFESLGTMPKANEVAEGYDAAFVDEFFDPAAPIPEPDASTATVPVPPAPTVPTVPTDAAPALVAEKTAAADMAVVADDKQPDTEAPTDEADEELATNPFLEQSVLDEVRAMGESLGSPSLAAQG